ncbi:hypothetical protein KFE25_014086 [Diacronema lutheri]|uniref:SET domain-containing protein n=1 Tax=Diacronema lutheri TaxID=2081491 RepID=A0A8J6BZW1_DIALT|nr:hypothetical protein KFE25_014086 [Diacronema lutheri]
MAAAGLAVRSHEVEGRHYAAVRGFVPGEVLLTAPLDVCAALWPSPLHVSRPTAAELAILRRNPGVQLVRSNARTEGGGGEVFTLLAAAWLLAIRALLMHGTPTWARLMSLDDNARLRGAADAAVVHHFATQLHAALDDESGPTLGEVARLLGAILVNVFGTRSTPREPAPDGLALVVAASLFNHSCEPNAIVDLDGAREDGGGALSGAMSVRALAPIAQGEPVLVAYVDTIEPRYHRRRQLAKSKNFECACARCADPTDGGRFASAVRCRACARGWQLEQLWSSAAGDGEWLCAACGARTPERDVRAWDAAMRARLDALLAAPAKSSGAVDDSARAGEAYAQLVADALEWCHPNHAIVVQALVAAVREHARAAAPAEAAAADAAPASALAAAERVIRAAERALGALERTAPPYDAQKADVLFQIGCARHALARATRGRVPAATERAALLDAAAALRGALAQFRVCGGDACAGSRASHALAGACLRATHALN